MRSLQTLCLLLTAALLGSLLAPRAALGGAFAPAANSWTLVQKTTDESRASNTTLTADSTLVVSLAASTKYRVRAFINFTSPDTPDFKWGLDGPASPTLLAIQYTQTPALSTPSSSRSFGQYSDLASFSATGAPATAVNERGSVRLDGIIHNGSNAGTFSFLWSQNTSDSGTTSVLAGSYIEYKVIQ